MGGRSFLTKSLVNINIIVDFFMDPCDAPVSVYLETLFPAVMDMLVDMYAFDVSEYQQQKPFSSLAPKQLKSMSKVRRGAKGGGNKRWRAIFDALSSDPGELLGKRMAKHYGGSRRILTGGNAHLWLLGGAVQRAAFWVWFVSRIGELFYDWYMGIIAKGYCSSPEAGVVLAAEGIDSSHALFGWKPLVVWTKLKQRGSPDWSIVYGTSGNFSCAVSVRMTIALVGGSIPVRFYYRVYSDGPEGEQLQTEGMRIVTYPNKVDVNFSFNVPKFSNYTIEVRNSDGLVDIFDIYIHGKSNGLIEFSPVQPWPRDFRGQREG